MKQTNRTNKRLTTSEHLNLEIKKTSRLKYHLLHMEVKANKIIPDRDNNTVNKFRGYRVLDSFKREVDKEGRSLKVKNSNNILSKRKF